MQKWKEKRLDKHAERTMAVFVENKNLKENN